MPKRVNAYHSVSQMHSSLGMYQVIKLTAVLNSLAKNINYYKYFQIHN